MNKIFKILGIICLYTGLTHTIFAAPATLTQTVTRDGETVTMKLTKLNLRGSNFELLTQNAEGKYDTVSPVAERSYIGTVDEYPGAVSCGIQLDNGTFKGAIYFDRGATWFTLGSTVESTRGLEYNTFSDFKLPSQPSVKAGQGGTTMYGFELSIDAANDFYVGNGSKTAKSFESIEYSIALNRGIYMRDALLRPYLGRIILRTTLAKSPYSAIGSGQGGTFLGAVKTEWNDNQTDVNPDLVAGISPNKIGGGLALVSVVGTDSKYSVNQSSSNGGQVFDVILRHEMGHNWGNSHHIGGSPEGTGIMGGNSPARFSGPEVQRILAHRDNRIAAGGILDNDGTYTTSEIPPYASFDVARFSQKVDSSITIDVLANDHDANGQTLSVLSYDRVSAQGGAITILAGKLIYTAPKFYIGTDYFSYLARDTAGKTAKGIVVIDVSTSDDLRLHLPLEETEGTAVSDVSLYKNAATLSGTTLDSASIAGKFGNALDLDGVDDHVEIPDMNLSSNTVTMTAWIRQGTTQNSYAGIIFDNSDHPTGLNMRNNKSLGYHWDGPADQWRWNSGLTPPDNTWTFVALVVEPTKATMYMNSGAGFTTATNNAIHHVKTFRTTYVGWEPSNGGRHFSGGIDDPRIYSRALSLADLETVYKGGGAESPNPSDGATNITLPLLKWSAGLNATSHDVYIGIDRTAVTNANQLSPEFHSNTTSTQLTNDLDDDTEYFWRVDTVTSSGTLTGRVWSFTTGKILKTILVDFAEGGAQVLKGGELIGPTGVNSSHWNQTTGKTGTKNALIDYTGAATTADLEWTSANTWRNNDSADKDETRMALGYLDDAETTNGKGLRISLSNIPYANYRVYGLFTTDLNDGEGGSCKIRNFDVNGTWALGGNSATTADAWGTIASNKSNNKTPWTRIIPGSVQGNYWAVNSTGATCNIIGEIKDSPSRGSLSALIIQDISSLTALEIWRLDNFGNLDNAGIAADTEDADGDGVSNIDEYNAGTDPNDRDSRLHISSLVVSGNKMVISFPSVIGKTYHVKRSANLTNGSWITVKTKGVPQENIAGTGNTINIIETNGSTRSQRFYRIVVE